MNFIFDLDGTLTDDGHRQHLINQDPPDMEAYHLASHLDAPKELLLCMTRELFRDNNVEIWTGRSDIVEQRTITWLRKHSAHYHTLRMRTAGDEREASVLKQSWLVTAPYIHPANTIVFDDRTPQVQWWRSLGFTCLDVAGHAY